MFEIVERIFKNYAFNSIHHFEAKPWLIHVPKLSGKKSELPLARYVCDFLRATIFASDPYVLAVAWLWNSGQRSM